MKHLKRTSGSGIQEECLLVYDDVVIELLASVLDRFNGHLKVL